MVSYVELVWHFNSHLSAVIEATHPAILSIVEKSTKPVVALQYANQPMICCDVHNIFSCCRVDILENIKKNTCIFYHKS